MMSDITDVHSPYQSYHNSRDLSEEVDEDEDEERTPSRQNYKTTGMLGMLVFTTILIITSVAYKHRGKYSPFFLAFFSSISLVCILELPRYLLMTMHGKYTSQVGYALHIMASYFYLLCLTMIAHLWSTFVELGCIEMKIYSKMSLAIFNINFLVLTVVATVFCLTASSLETYFDSFTFRLLTIVEIVANMIYSMCLGFLAWKLVMR